MWTPWKSRTWSNKKIAFVAILIATSVAFILLFARTAPITSIPSMKLMAGGLPIKLTGYIFGPLIGVVTGIIADLISFAIVPTFIHWWYMLAFALAGAIPGVVAFFMHRRWKFKGPSNPADETKINSINFIFTLVVLLLVAGALVGFTMYQSDAVFEHQKLIKNRYVFLAITLVGSGTMFIGVFIFRFVLKPKTFNAILPIIVFSSIMEIVNTPLIALGDQAVFGLHDDFITVLTAHFMLSPVKIWVNLIIIFFAYKIVSPLIFNKTGNGWDGREEASKIKEKEVK